MLQCESVVGNIYTEYMINVQITNMVENGQTYTFEAPNHNEISFGTAGTAELHVDIYVDVNGFEEAGTGDHGVLPVIIQATEMPWRHI